MTTNIEPDRAPPQDANVSELQRTDQPVPRADATLIYVPGLGHDALNTADIIAASVAASGSEYGPALIAANETLPPATPGLTAVATIKRGERRLLDVTELDYRQALEGLADDDGKEGVAPNLFVQSWYAALGLGLSFKAWRARSKSRKAQFQLLLGAAGAFTLFAAFLLTLVSFVTTLLMAWDVPVPELVSSSAPWVALFGGLVTTTALASGRKVLLRGGRRIQQVLRYFNEEEERNKITAALRRAVDALAESGYQGDIHVLAYSFGSIVALDAYTHGGSPGRVPDGIVATKSLVTVGCPHDFVALYMPSHHEARQPWRPELPWQNVFVASDVFGSNFESDERSDTVAGVRQTDLGWTVVNHRHLLQEELTWGRVLLGVGLRKHNTYWDKSGGCWDSLLSGWGLVDNPMGPP